MTHTNGWICVAAVAMGLAGCSGASVPAAGNAALGIAAYDVTESAAELKVTGLGVKGEKLAEVALFEGTFKASDGVVTDGRRLVVKMDGITQTHESAGHGELKLPTPEARLGLLLLDLAPRLSEHGVGFEFSSAGKRGSIAPANRERAYADCGTDDPGFSASCGCTSACNVYDGNNWTGYQFVCCGGSHTGVMRFCTGNPNSSNACGPTGAGGCAVCWSSSYPTNGGCVTTGDGENCSIDWLDQGTGCAQDSQCGGNKCCSGTCMDVDECP